MATAGTFAQTIVSFYLFHSHTSMCFPLNALCPNSSLAPHPLQLLCRGCDRQRKASGPENTHRVDFQEVMEQKVIMEQKVSVCKIMSWSLGVQTCTCKLWFISETFLGSAFQGAAPLSPFFHGSSKPLRPESACRLRNMDCNIGLWSAGKTG